MRWHRRAATGGLRRDGIEHRRADRILAGEPAGDGQPLPFVELPDQHHLGTGPQPDLQRRLPAALRREALALPRPGLYGVLVDALGDAFDRATAGETSFLVNERMSSTATATSRRRSSPEQRRRRNRRPDSRAVRPRPFPACPRPVRSEYDRHSHRYGSVTGRSRAPPPSAASCGGRRRSRNAFVTWRHGRCLAPASVGFGPRLAGGTRTAPEHRRFHSCCRTPGSLSSRSSCASYPWNAWSAPPRRKSGSSSRWRASSMPSAAPPYIARSVNASAKPPDTR